MVTCDNCDAEMSADEYRCPSCGATVPTLDRALIVIITGLLLIPVGFWGVWRLRTYSDSLSTISLFGTLLLIALPLVLLYAGSQLYRHRMRKLKDE